MSTQLMIDIETLGTGPTAHVLQIGICPFRFEEDWVGEPTTFGIDPEVAQPGSSIDGSTVRWWIDSRRQEAWGSIMGHPTHSPALASAMLIQEISEHGDRITGVWAKSPQFDLVILRHFFEWYCHKVPWEFRIERDLRTLVAMGIDMGIEHDIDAIRAGVGGVRHTAGFDAQVQATHAVMIGQDMRERLALPKS